MPVKPLDNYLRSFRHKAGLSQDEVSFLLGTRSGKHVSRYETGSRDPSLDAALALAAIFGISVQELFAGRSSKVEQAVKERAALLGVKLAEKPDRKRALSTVAAISSREI